MPVPGNWELNGYGFPIYVNIGSVQASPHANLACRCAETPTQPPHSGTPPHPPSLPPSPLPPSLLLPVGDRYAIKPEPPKVVYKGVDPDYNPTGVYRTTVTLPADWFASLDGHDLYLRVGAVTSAMYVYVNGQEVGYSQVRRAPNCQAADPKRNTKASPRTRL